MDKFKKAPVKQPEINEILDKVSFALSESDDKGVSHIVFGVFMKDGIIAPLTAINGEFSVNSAAEIIGFLLDYLISSDEDESSKFLAKATESAITHTAFGRIISEQIAKLKRKKQH